MINYNTKMTNGYIALMLLMISYVFISYLCLYFGYATSIFNYNLRKYILLLSYVIAFILLLKKLIVKKRNKIYSVVLSAALFIGYVCISNILTKTANGITNIDISWWFVILLSASSANINEKSLNRLFFIGGSVGTIIGIIYIAKIHQLNYIANNVNAIYYSLLFLPMILCINNRLVKSVFLIVIAFAIFFSGKGAGSLALVIGLITFFFISMTESNKSNKSIFKIIAAITILYVVYVVVLNHYAGVNIFNEVNTFKFTSNSRGIIWERLLKSYSSLSNFRKLFGTGYSGVTNALGISAHNDFLEVMYDYGLAGLLLYIVFIITQIKEIFILRKRKSKYTAAYASSVIMFIVLSIFTHLILLPTYFLAMAYFWGIILSTEFEVSRHEDCSSRTWKFTNTSYKRRSY